jgi:hypothetical protein
MSPVSDSWITSLVSKITLSTKVAQVDYAISPQRYKKHSKRAINIEAVITCRHSRPPIDA